MNTKNINLLRRFACLGTILTLGVCLSPDKLNAENASWSVSDAETIQELIGYYNNGQWDSLRLELDNDITLQETILVTYDAPGSYLQVIGYGNTLSMQNSGQFNRHFTTFGGSTLELQHVTLSGGVASGGAGGMARDWGVEDGPVYPRNGTPGGGGMGAGGAIFIGAGSKVTAFEVTFSNNQAQGGPGGDGMAFTQYPNAQNSDATYVAGAGGGGVGGNGGSNGLQVGGGGGGFAPGSDGQEAPGNDFESDGGAGGGPNGGAGGVVIGDSHGQDGGPQSGGGGAGGDLYGDKYGGNGGWGGGGGGAAASSSDDNFAGGAGGFGGGGGGGAPYGGDGGFGGGAGAGSRYNATGGSTVGSNGAPGYGGGEAGAIPEAGSVAGTYPEWATPGAGGGAGFGGAVFIEEGGSFVIQDTFGSEYFSSFSGNNVVGGGGGYGAPETQVAQGAGGTPYVIPASAGGTAGSAEGRDIFLQGTSSFTLETETNENVNVNFVIETARNTPGGYKNLDGSTVNKTGGGTITITAAGSAGMLSVNEGEVSLQADWTGDVSVLAGATFSGNGYLDGALAMAGGAVVAPGNSPGTMNVQNFTLSDGTILEFELAQPGVYGEDISDFVAVTDDLVLDGLLDIVILDGFEEGEHYLFSYGGTLTDNDLQVRTLTEGYTAIVDNVSQPGLVLLNVQAVPEPSSALLLGVVGALALGRRRRR